MGSKTAPAPALAPPMRTSAVQADIVKPANMQTLPSDPYNMLAQFGGLGYQPAAFDPTGSNNGYYGNATFIRSPLMQRYLQPTSMNTGAWVTNGLQNAMPGWNAVSTPGQNPYYTASQRPAPLFPTNTQFAGAVNPADLPGVNGNPYSSMWNQRVGAQGMPQQTPQQTVPMQGNPFLQNQPRQGQIPGSQYGYFGDHSKNDLTGLGGTTIRSALENEKRLQAMGGTLQANAQEWADWGRSFGAL